jgi:N-acetylmuramoyl-L-alanine amidase
MSSDNSTANLAVAQKENSAILLESNYETNYGGFDPNSVDAYIIFSLLQNKYLDQSTKFASKIQYQFRENVKLSDRGVKQAGFLVLWRTTMPSVLVEAGFLSNPKEEAFLGSEKGQNVIAYAIYNAFNQMIKEKKGLMVEPAISISSDTSLPESQEEIKTPEIKTIDGVVFRVQISCLAENKRLNDPVFKGIQPIFMWKNGNYYCYAAGEETNYEEAKALLERIKSQGFPDAFLIAFKNGEKISIKEALKYLKN